MANHLGISKHSHNCRRLLLGNWNTLRDKNMREQANYQRQQTPHSLTKLILLSCMGVGIPWLIYYSISPNHYWTA